MKGIIIVILALLLTVAAPAQKAPAKPRTPAQEYILKKQIFVDDVESSLGTVPYAAVRVKVRYELAAWLWRNGKDDTGRAEGLAVKAVDELYEKIDEIENPEWRKSELFKLLEKNAKETAAKLKAKYFTSAGEDLDNALDLFDEPGGDKEAARRLIKAINTEAEFDWRASSIVNELSETNSPELAGVIAAIINSVNSGKLNLDTASLGYVLEAITTDLPESLRKRYFLIVIDRARASMSTPNSTDEALYYTLLDAIKLLGSSAPDLIPEAEAIAGNLASRASKVSAEMREINERIAASEDKLAATMEEAARAPTTDMRTRLYTRAEQLALEQNKFLIAIEAIEILKEINKDNPNQFFKLYPDQEFAIIAKKALDNSAEEAALKAISKIDDDIRRAESWKEAAIFYESKKNLIYSDDALNKCIKLLADANRENSARAHALLRLLPTVLKIAKPRVQEVVVLATKAVNDLPTPGAGDKPGTENFKKYISTVMALIVNMRGATRELLIHDKAGIEDFTGRLQKREVRIYAELMTGMNKIDSSRLASKSTR